MADRKKIELDQQPVWDIQFDETAKAYNAFALYRDLLDRRSLSKVASKLGVSQQALVKWSVPNRWVERAEAYDLYLDRKWREARETEIGRMARTEATLGRALVSGALRRAVGHIDPNDPTKSVDSLNWNELSAGEVAHLARVGVDISRISTNRATSLVKGALMIHAREYEEDMTLLTQALFVYIPDERKPAAAEWVRAFAAGEINRELTA